MTAATGPATGWVRQTASWNRALRSSPARLTILKPSDRRPKPRRRRREPRQTGAIAGEACVRSATPHRQVPLWTSHRTSVPTVDVPAAGIENDPTCGQPHRSRLEKTSRPPAAARFFLRQVRAGAGKLPGFRAPRYWMSPLRGRNGTRGGAFAPATQPGKMGPPANPLASLRDAFLEHPHIRRWRFAYLRLMAGIPPGCRGRRSLHIPR